MAQQPSDEPQVSTVELREQIRGKWQIPLLILSIGCFVAAVLFLVYPREAKTSGEKLLQQARATFQAKDFASTIRLCRQLKTRHPRHGSAGAVDELQGDASCQLSRQVLDSERDFLKQAQISYGEALESGPQGKSTSGWASPFRQSSTTTGRLRTSLRTAWRSAWRRSRPCGVLSRNPAWTMRWPSWPRSTRNSARERPMPCGTRLP